jgi:hypothetical protein
MEDITALRVIYSANILVAGVCAVCSLFFSKFAKKRLFDEDDMSDSNATYITGSFWMAITITSILGLVFPIQF